MKLLRILIALGVLFACPLNLAAHEMSMAELELREVARGEFVWHWAASSDKRGNRATLSPTWPSNCVSEPNLLHCDDTGLAGTVGIGGVGESVSAVLLKVTWIDGQKSVHTLTGSQPTVQLYGSADDRRNRWEIARAYSVLGVEHILSGFDHLVFVLALLFLVNFNRRLLLTITAFTLAHSLTLALSALGWLVLRSSPVEATIALSIMLVAGEALHKEQTLSRRWPALLAFVFGLVHGLGFAGALTEIGLPENHLPVALLTFNLGVEAGQLLVVAVAYAIHRALAKWPTYSLARVPALYAIGGVAAFWSAGRIAAIFP